MTNCRRESLVVAVGVEVTRLNMRWKSETPHVVSYKEMPGEHRGKLAVCVGAAAVRESWRLESRNCWRKCGRIALRGDDLQNDRGISSSRREISNRTGCFERELFLGSRQLESAPLPGPASQRSNFMATDRQSCGLAKLGFANMNSLPGDFVYTFDRHFVVVRNSPLDANMRIATWPKKIMEISRQRFW